MHVANPWAQDADTVLKKLRTKRSGMSKAEAVRRRKNIGANQIRVPSKLTELTLFLNQLKSPLIIALIVAAVISVAISLLTSEPKWIEAIVIGLAVITNVALGYWQEHKAEQSLELLNNYTRVQARVRRGDGSTLIDARKLVPGDVIELSPGDRIPADARVLSAHSCKVNESALTGESLTVSKTPASVDKDAALGDRTSMLYNGTSVVEGNAVAVITAIGKETAFGEIAELVADTKSQKTPLQRQIESFATKASIALFGLGVLLFAVGWIAGQPLSAMFFIALAAIVSAVPEGLPVAVTVVLSIGVERLARRKGVVRKLLAAETLGSTTTILTDKTGTLTEADMTLDTILVPEDAPTDRRTVLEYAVTNTDVSIDNPSASPDNWEMHGEPLEKALVRAYGKNEMSPHELISRSEAFERLPFSAERKWSATAMKTGGEQCRIDVLGAPEEVLELCGVSHDQKQQILETVTAEAQDGARVIALASTTVDEMPDDIEATVSNTSLTYHALLLFRDPIRYSVADAITRIADAGVRTVMVTGDHAGTAGYVARELDLIQSQDEVIDSSRLADLSDDELHELVGSARVFARVTPRQKVRVLQAIQDRGEVVAVTGDGVNDAPALKTADIGVAMGSGTDVAKSASDLIILDDNYKTIVAAIEEGRKIMKNLRKVIIFLLCDSFDELILIGGSIVAMVALPLSAIQILFVKVFTDTLPSLAFPFDRGSNELSQRPDMIRSTLFDKQTKIYTIGRGLFSAALLFVLYYGLLSFTTIDPTLVRTFVFASFSTYILFMVFPLRSIEHNIWEYNPFSNWWMNGAVAFGVLMTGSAIYFPPLSSVLGTGWMPLQWIIGVIAFSLINVVSMEALKWWLKPRTPDSSSSP